MAGIGDITGTLEPGKCEKEIYWGMAVGQGSPEESVRRSTGASKCGYGHRTGKSDPCSQGEEKADRRDGAGQISELEWNGNVCFRRIELYSDA